MSRLLFALVDGCMFRQRQGRRSGELERSRDRHQRQSRCLPSSRHRSVVFKDDSSLLYSNNDWAMKLYSASKKYLADFRSRIRSRKPEYRRRRNGQSVGSPTADEMRLIRRTCPHRKEVLRGISVADCLAHDSQPSHSRNFSCCVTP